MVFGVVSFVLQFCWWLLCILIVDLSFLILVGCFEGFGFAVVALPFGLVLFVEAWFEVLVWGAVASVCCRLCVVVLYVLI